ncbi:MAG: hypothetical protein WCF90_02265 [Methanomicrobiales archaeon]
MCDYPPGLVNTTLYLPSSALLIVKVQPIDVEKETETPAAAIDRYPGLVTFTVRPLSILAPVMVTPTTAFLPPAFRGYTGNGGCILGSGRGNLWGNGGCDN